MAEKTNIEWCDHTFNPWRGCSKVNTGCKNCYADRNAHRMPGTFGVFGSEAQGGTRVVASEAMWRDPVKWNRQAGFREGSLCPNCGGKMKFEDVLTDASGEILDGASLNCTDCPTSWTRRDMEEHRIRPRVFCASLADVFEDWEGPMVDHKGACLGITMHDARARLFSLIDDTPHLDWQLLTKRPENIRRMWEHTRSDNGRFRKNVWLGTSVADQATAEQAIPELLKCHDLAAKLFLSVEPLVGPVDLLNLKCYFCDGAGHGTKADPDKMCGMCGATGVFKQAINGIDWVIVGGESGPKARPCNVEWIRDIVKQCESAGVPCFVKQLGANCEFHRLEGWTAGPGLVKQGNCWRIATSHPKGGDPSEWPEDLRVRQFPEDDQ